MTLKLAIDITANSAGAKKGIAETRAELAGLKGEAEKAAGGVGRLTEAFQAEGKAATQATAAMRQLRAAERDAAQAMRGANANSRQAVGSTWSQLRPDQRFGVARQAPDILGSLAMGMSPSMVAMQQGPQIVEAVGGFGNALKIARESIPPVTALLGGMTVALGVGATAWLDYTGRMKEARVAAQAFGLSTGTTAADIERVSAQAAAAGNVSVSMAREIATSLTRSGRIGADQLLGLTAIAKDFAAVMNTDVVSASGKLGDIFGDPAKGAAQLRQMGLLDGATERLVKRLNDQNRTVEAGNVLLNAVTPRLQGAATATTAIGRAAEWSARMWDNLWGSMGSAVDRLFGGGPDSLEGRLAQLQERLRNMPTLAGRLQNPNQRQALTAEIADLQEQIRLRNRVQANAASAATDDRRGSAALDIARGSPANDMENRRRELENQIAALRAGQGAGGLSAAEDESITRAIQAKENALKGLTTAQERMTQVDRLDVQISRERDPVARADLIARRERLALAGEEITSAEVEVRANQARSRALLEMASASGEAARSLLATQREQSEMLRLEISLLGQSEGARSRAIALLQVEQQIRSQGIGKDSPAAEQLRRQALETSDMETQLARQQDALQTFRNTGEQSIDSLTDTLLRNGGSWKSWGDVATSVLEDVASSAMKLAVTNPLKNALFGTNYGTMGDLGGAGGGGGGGGGGLFSGLLGIGGSLISGMLGMPMPMFAKGGVATRASVFGESGPEAAVPLPDGRSIPVELRGGSGGAQRGGTQVNVSIQNNHGGAAVSTGPVTMGPDGTPTLTVMVQEIVRGTMLDDLAGDGPISQGFGGRFGVSAAGGLYT